MQSIPVQSWTFEQEPVVRIGRSTDNHVILYSAVVSRHHVEIRKTDAGWDIVNLGANGTYLEGRRISQVPVEDGVIIRLARSGPNVQIHLGAKTSEKFQNLVGEKTISQRSQPPVGASGGIQTKPPEMMDEVAIDGALNEGVRTDIDSQSSNSTQSSDRADSIRQKKLAFHLQTVSEDNPDLFPETTSLAFPLSLCCQRYLESGRLFCLDCGKPLRVVGTIADYQVIKTVEQDTVGSTQLAWQDGKTVILRTLHPDWVQQAEAAALFEQEARQLLTLKHPALPRFSKVFIEKGKPYLVMEPTYGQSLQQVVAKEGTIQPAIAIAWMGQICDALDYLHQQTPPVLHQDLNPKNLIRRSTTEPTGITIVGFTPGRILQTAIQQSSPNYTAPEQHQGQAFPASDLYALAPTLVFLLTGKSPNAFYSQREQGFRFYPEYVPGLSSGLIAILRKLTHPDPMERYPSAKDLTQALQSLTIALV